MNDITFRELAKISPMGALILFGIIIISSLIAVYLIIRTYRVVEKKVFGNNNMKYTAYIILLLLIILVAIVVSLSWGWWLNPNTLGSLL